MSSTFQRANRVSFRRGTKPLHASAVVTSTGLRELDAILGGGHSMQSTILLIGEERYNYKESLTHTLAKYWIAEGVSHAQKIMIVSGNGYDEEDLVNFTQSCPKNMHYEKRRKTREIPPNDSTNTNYNDSIANEMGTFTIAEFGSEGEDEEEASDTMNDDEGLKIAWQYKASVQKARMGCQSATKNKKHNSVATSSGDNVFCHSYELSERMQKEQYDLVRDVNNNTATTISAIACATAPIHFLAVEEMIGGISHHHDPYLIFKCLLGQVRKYISYHKNEDVIRLLLLDVDIQLYSVVLPLLSTVIITEELPVCIVCTVSPLKCDAYYTKESLRNLKRACDTVFSIDSFVGYHEPPPPEFHDLDGIIEIERIIGGGLNHGLFADRFARPANRYGLKRDRRKLHIQMLHLPPEDFAKEGSSVGSGAVRTSGGSLSSSFDF